MNHEDLYNSLIQKIKELDDDELLLLYALAKRLQKMDCK